MTTQEFIDNGMLEGFAREQLGADDMSNVALQLTFDLILGEELERIYVALEQAGE